MIVESAWSKLRDSLFPPGTDPVAIEPFRQVFYAGVLAAVKYGRAAVRDEAMAFLVEAGKPVTEVRGG